MDILLRRIPLGECFWCPRPAVETAEATDQKASPQGKLARQRLMRDKTGFFRKEKSLQSSFPPLANQAGKKTGQSFSNEKLEIYPSSVACGDTFPRGKAFGNDKPNGFPSRYKRVRPTKRRPFGVKGSDRPKGFPSASEAHANGSDRPQGFPSGEAGASAPDEGQDRIFP